MVQLERNLSTGTAKFGILYLVPALPQLLFTLTTMFLSNNPYSCMHWSLLLQDFHIEIHIHHLKGKHNRCSGSFRVFQPFAEGKMTPLIVPSINGSI